MRSFRSHAAAVGRERSRFHARRFGEELRLARMAIGLTQAQLASGARLSQQIVSDAERGRVDISLELRCRLASACGHELGWRLYPVRTISLRDSGQLAIPQAIVIAAHPSWTAELERPVAPTGLRAADLVLSRPDEVIHIEVERALVDAQAQLRAARLKRAALAQDESRPVRLVLALPDTEASRHRLLPITSLLDHTLPGTPKDIWRAIRRGHPIGADGILFVRPDRANRLPRGETNA
jgi:transcriptional regulator with XRE-family HTH domain